MRHKLRIQLRVCEGAIIRALGLIERRGFRLDAVTVGEAQGDGQSMDVVVSGDRSPDLLQRQLERLHDVSWVAQVNNGGLEPHNGMMRPVHGAQ
jgi:acetolactate synthase regulatory subunit